MYNGISKSRSQNDEIEEVKGETPNSRSKVRAPSLQRSTGGSTSSISEFKAGTVRIFIVKKLGKSYQNSHFFFGGLRPPIPPDFQGTVRPYPIETVRPWGGYTVEVT